MDGEDLGRLRERERYNQIHSLYEKKKKKDHLGIVACFNSTTWESEVFGSEFEACLVHTEKTYLRKPKEN